MSVFQYNPSAARPLPNGWYRATLVEVNTSPDRVQFFWETVDPRDNSTRRIQDTITHRALWKLKALAYALQRGAEFEAGAFDAEKHIGSGLWLHLAPSTVGGNLMSVLKFKNQKPVAVRPSVRITDEDEADFPEYVD